MDYKSITDIVLEAERTGKTVGELVLEDQAMEMEEDKEVLFQRMALSLSVMEEAVEKGMDKDIRSTSGLTGGDAYRMNQYAKNGGITGTFMTKAMARAIAVSEYNAAMGKIVASPTAGSCGIMPGCLVSMIQDQNVDREKVIYSMFAAAGFGMVIANRSSISGAQGGCQAECGSASGITAAAVVEVMGGTPKQMADACAIAIKNQLGLVCDPVAGLVEIPCIKRNVSGIMIAFSAAEMALAGIESKIPIDEVVDAMKSVGDSLPCALKETALGGLADTPTGKKLKELVFGE